MHTHSTNQENAGKKEPLRNNQNISNAKLYDSNKITIR